MSDLVSDAPAFLPVDAGAATDRESWLRLIDQIGEEAGYFQTVGARHWAFFVDASPTLLVSFESADQIRARPGQMPLAHGVARAAGCSCLCLIADGDTWYRDPAVYAYIDRLVDDAFFEDFDRVVFYGAGMGATAACAFSVAAPGATVLAITPRATLNPAQAGWDRRNPGARKLDFTSRYGYGPDMVEGTGRVFLVLDPLQREDAMHAALFRAAFVVPLPARHIGPDPEAALAQMTVLVPLIGAALDGSLNATLFARLWRKRRDHAPYLKALLDRAFRAGRSGHEAMICRSVTRRLRASRFRRRLAELTTRAQ